MPQSLPNFIAKTKPLLMGQLDQLTQFNLEDPRQQLATAMRHTLLAPSKCFRGLLVCATHRIFSDTVDTILPVACAIEMLHTGSLIYDDLPCMDNDTLRRGQPCCHCLFGEDIAILAAYTLQCYAYEILNQPTNFDPKNQLAMMQFISQACGIHGIAGGQALDLIQARSSEKISPVETIHALKTGATIVACVCIPAILHGADPTTLDTLKKTGSHLGLLFQIVDDILDVVSPSETLGKTANKDSEQNKFTYISELGLAGAKAEAQHQADCAKKQLDSLNYPNNHLYGFVEWAQTRIH
ncbi:polyprenyl synthetase family protein [Candidatus Marinamargulisbacteria bacterium]|nr:polyprenyl synthetase family protein [Candidatus Marinamargulisbacteria bacterium]|tara:strand:- start:3524 stop:4414 length:891 start_codon:yes stop_codon:yes gene_type:complete